MKKICLLTDQHICTNPRLWKEAKALSLAGYKVVILSIFTTRHELERDLELLEGDPQIEYKPVLNLIKGEVLEMKRFYYRLRRRIFMQIKRVFDFDHSLLLGYAPDLLFKAAINENAALYIAHMECSLFVGVQLLKLGYKVGFDMEDWYSRDYLVRERPVQLLKNLEQVVLNHASYVSCPSAAMAEALVNTYESTQPPLVIYNSFSKKETPQEKLLPYRSDRPSIIWFSQTIGPGRGLENFMRALEQVEQILHVKLIGDIDDDYRQQLETLFPFQKGHSFEMSAQIPHGELTTELSRHQIGLALEQNIPESRNVTITNKIFQYLQAGIRVLATNTEGQISLSHSFSGICIVDIDNPNSWANGLNSLLKMENYDENIVRNKFDLELSWECQEIAFLQKIRSIV